MTLGTLSPSRPHGVLAPVVTPFDAATLAPDTSRFIAHCRWLLDHGCNGLAVFGTNSEANSLAMAERRDLLESLINVGVSGARLMPGTGCCSIPETVNLTRHAMDLGCAGVLVLPPFYYKGVSEEGLFRYFSEVIERVGCDKLRVYLYHIPPVAQVNITVGLIERLRARYPAIIAGIKDSSGDWTNTQAFIDHFAADGFDVFAGSETFLLRTLEAGGKGCITAGANVNPHGIAEVYAQWKQPQAAQLQAQADTVRKILQSQASMIPALKAVVAHFAGDPAWTSVRPPLVELDKAAQADLIKALAELSFDMPGRANRADAQ